MTLVLLRSSLYVFTEASEHAIAFSLTDQRFDLDFSSASVRHL